jgi:hypothetical protein
MSRSAFFRELSLHMLAFSGRDSTVRRTCRRLGYLGRFVVVIAKGLWYGPHTVREVEAQTCHLPPDRRDGGVPFSVWPTDIGAGLSLIVNGAPVGPAARASGDPAGG